MSFIQREQKSWSLMLVDLRRKQMSESNRELLEQHIAKWRSGWLIRKDDESYVAVDKLRKRYGMKVLIKRRPGLRGESVEVEWAVREWIPPQNDRHHTMPCWPRTNKSGSHQQAAEYRCRIMDDAERAHNPLRDELDAVNERLRQQDEVIAYLYERDEQRDAKPVPVKPTKSAFEIDFGTPASRL
jgi:hypothetical protein